MIDFVPYIDHMDIIQSDEKKEKDSGSEDGDAERKGDLSFLFDSLSYPFFPHFE